MKKITLILTAFLLIIGVQSYAQEVIPAERGTERIGHDDQVKDARKARKFHRKRGLKRAKLRKKANRRQLRSMRRVANADGRVTRGEKAAIRQEKRRMRRDMKRSMKKRKVKRRHRMNDSAPSLRGRDRVRQF